MKICDAHLMAEASLLFQSDKNANILSDSSSLYLSFFTKKVLFKFGNKLSFPSDCLLKVRFKKTYFQTSIFLKHQGIVFNILEKIIISITMWHEFQFACRHLSGMDHLSGQLHMFKLSNNYEGVMKQMIYNKLIK